MGKLTTVMIVLSGMTGMAVATGFARGSNSRAVSKAFHEWSAGQGSLFDLMTDDAFVVIPGTAPHCGTFEKNAFVKDVATPFMARFAKPPRPRALKVWCAGNDVVVLADAEGTTRDGVRYANNYVFVLKMRGGRIAQATEFLDMTAFNDVWDRVAPAPVGTAAVK